MIQGIRYAGLLAIRGDDALLRMLEDKLPSATFAIRFDPANPNISYLTDPYDPRFQGATVTQNPEYLDRAPEFHISDVLRRD